nr:immunoglobulin heavy chain junction region [Macaca mulatta]
CTRCITGTTIHFDYW